MMIVLIAVTTVILALLAMHFLLSESPAPEGHGVNASASLLGALAAETPVAGAAQSNAPTPENCVETCSPAHNELTMACVLVLLGSALLILVHYLRFQFRMRSTLFQPAYQNPFAPIPAHQPSLHLLSISRT